MDLIAVLLSLFAGFTFGLSVFIQRRGLDGTDDVTGTFISVVSMAALFWVLAPWQVEAEWWSARSVWIFVVCGLLFPSLGQRLQIASVQRVGAALTSAVGSLAPLFAVVPAVIFLGEHINLQAASGIFIVVLGLVLASVAHGTGLRNRATLALLLPLGASVVRGIIQPLAKAGYVEIPSAFFGTMIMCTVSTVVVAGMLMISGQPSRVLRPTGGHRWFLLNGVVIGVGILAMQYALKLGEVTIVAPLVATTPLWTVLLAALFFRSETLSWRHGMTALLVVVGSVLIVTR